VPSVVAQYLEKVTKLVADRFWIVWKHCILTPNSVAKWYNFKEGGVLRLPLPRKNAQKGRTRVLMDVF
jgi:hypothetical protein